MMEMIPIIRFAIIFTIFAFGNCEDEENKKNFLMVPIRVRREPPYTVEFQFNKAAQIEPISLKANEVNFQLSEENDVKKFRNTIPLQQEEQSQAIKISLEYREPEKNERKVKSFMHAFRESLDEVITVKIEISLPKAHPESENPMEHSSNDAIGAPTHPPAVPNLKAAMDDDFENEFENDEKNYADKLLNTALRHSKLGTHLLLKGLDDTSVNPVDAVREIITTKLELLHLEYNILQAKFVSDGLLFEMQSPRDVVEILSKKESIDLHGLDIVPTKQNIFDFSLDVRSSA